MGNNGCKLLIEKYDGVALLFVQLKGIPLGDVWAQLYSVIPVESLCAIASLEMRL